LRKLKTAFGRAALERPLGGGYPIEGRDDFWPINVQKHVELSELISSYASAAFGRRVRLRIPRERGAADLNFGSPARRGENPDPPVSGERQGDGDHQSIAELRGDLDAWDTAACPGWAGFEPYVEVRLG
jgi:hypothetical protein